MGVEGIYSIVWELREGIADFQLVQFGKKSPYQVSHLTLAFEGQRDFNRQKICKLHSSKRNNKRNGMEMTKEC